MLSQLVKMRCRQLAPSDKDDLSNCYPNPKCLLPEWIIDKFDWTKLQEDIVATYLAGKPLIIDPHLLHTPFQFSRPSYHVSEYVLSISLLAWWTEAIVLL